MYGDHTFVCRHELDVKKKAVVKGFAEDPRGDEAPAPDGPPPDHAPPEAAAGAAPAQTAEDPPAPDGQPARKAPRFDAKKECKILEARLELLEPLVGLVSELQAKIKVLEEQIRSNE